MNDAQRKRRLEQDRADFQSQLVRQLDQAMKREARVTQPTTDPLDENGIPASGLPRARDLIANYLWNEDGENEDWLHEAHDILKAATEARADRPPEPPTLDVERLERAIHAAHPGGRHLAMTDAEADRWRAENIAREYAALGASPPPPDLSEAARAIRELPMRWNGSPVHSHLHGDDIDLVSRREVLALIEGRATLATTGEPRDG